VRYCMCKNLVWKPIPSLYPSPEFRSYWEIGVVGNEMYVNPRTKNFNPSCPCVGIFSFVDLTG